jgi:haloacid dehalogenase-like hydrolase
MTALRNISLVAVSHDSPDRESALPASPSQRPLPAYLLASERDFYGSYPWSLNAYPRVGSVVEYLREELASLDQPTESWQIRERMTNIFLLACAITNEVDDYLVGTRYDFSKAIRIPLSGLAVRTFDRFNEYKRRVREWRLCQLTDWNQRWLTSLDEYLQLFVASTLPGNEVLVSAGSQLAKLLDTKLPEGLRSRRLRNPGFFHVRDLTHFDVLKLGEKFVDACPDRSQPIVLVGLRTAGSYFNPLLRAYLKLKGYQDVDSLTVRPRSAVGWREKAHIATCAKAERLAVILDEPPCSGGSTAGIAKILYKAGFARTKVVALFPVLYLYPEWRKGWGNLLDSGTRALTLEPEEWHKKELLQPLAVQSVVETYFTNRGYVSAALRMSASAESFNAQLQHFSEQKMHTRLKQVYEVQLQKRSGETETRYVLAKSVGWGWLGYRAYILGERLGQFVPPILGLRNGILYTEWLPQTLAVADQPPNGHSATLASYVASRVRLVALRDDPTADLIHDNQHKGYEELADLLGRAYGSAPAAALKRPRIQQCFAQSACPVPTLIDARMRPLEWIGGPSSLLKTDFEHHAMGKRELEMVDPAFDLAEAILHFKLSKTEEQKLIDRYVEESGDKQVCHRLFLNKLLAGTWSMIQALLNLNDQRLRHRWQEFNRQYLEAWQFLTIQTAWHCGRLCIPSPSARWQSPLVVLDVDGVLDRNVFFSFPSTTAAGMKAVSLLHSHSVAVTLDSARSLYEVKEYCDAYGFLGGVAEYGSAVWDAVNRQERVLASPETLSQLETLRMALRNIPGVFLNDTYQYSIRGFTYGRERTAPLPTLLIGGLIGDLKLDQLRFHQTELDTAVLAKDVDKGTGLQALVSQAGIPNLKTIAVGDSAPDLDMFRVANRSFAPSQISCGDKAAQLGCKISGRPYQSGLLEIVCSIVHPDRKRCQHCTSLHQARLKQNDLFMELLEVADRKRIPLLISAMLDPMAIRAFVK